MIVSAAGLALKIRGVGMLGTIARTGPSLPPTPLIYYGDMCAVLAQAHPDASPAAPAPLAPARVRRHLRVVLLPLLLYGLITLALFPSVAAHLGASFPGDLGDPPSQAWILAWDVHALTTRGAHLYAGNIFYPFHDVLAYQDALLGLLPLAAPLLLLTGNPVLTYNVLFLASFALCAWGAYLLALLLVKDARAAFLAGLVYGFSPYRMVHLSHLNLLWGMWIPLALLCWERVRRGENRYWVGVGLCTALQALSALYYAAFLAVALALLLLVQLRQSPRARMWPLLAGAALTALGCAVVLAPFLAPYVHVEHLLGGSRGLGQAIYFAADLRDFLHSVDLSVLYGWSGHVLGVRLADALQYLWPGATALALALYGRRAEGGGRRAEGEGRRAKVVGRMADVASGKWVAAPYTIAKGPSPSALRPSPYGLLLVVAAVLCLGPFLKVWGVQTGIPLPYLLLYPLPGFAGLRDPARFGAIYTVALAVLAAYGAAALLRSMERQSTTGRARGRGWLVAALLCLAVLAESWITPLPVAAFPTGAAVPPVYRWLAAHPSAPVLELPIGLTNKTIWAEQAEMMLYATYHWRPIVNGTGGFAPPGYIHDAAVYMDFPAAPALRLLQARGVRYVVVHRDWLGAHAAGAIRAKAAHLQGVRLAAHWPDADIYEVAKGARPNTVRARRDR